MSFLDPIVFWLDPLFRPLVSLNPFFAVVIISLLIAIIIKLIYWKTTDQIVMKALKEDMKKLQEQMRKSKENIKKLQEIQVKLMEKNMEYFKHSMKPLLFTMLPVLLVFGWMSLNLQYEHYTPNELVTATVLMEKATVGDVTVTVLRDSADRAAAVEADLQSKDRITIPDNGSVSFKLKAPEGKYILKYAYGNITEEQKLIVSTSPDYAPPQVVAKHAPFKTLTLDNKSRIVFTLFGIDFNWFWSYVIFSTIFSLILQKVMGLH